ncbi:GNAT family N-acetyltransferase [Haloarchaeobius iranensis]|uniref:Acetyltransferase (GNAT) family protein n=1 Tax=Haloarchaeobius iranensis TaxID=996166 RepID=A0A1G9W0Q5_9EURY|nr:GNAT family N-acetyltransferase [Haloarchaeobius iranensis]SDM77716.1 Acetyltransferase (GNAT) family protein [Haloarchaeobius iranensis]
MATNACGGWNVDGCEGTTHCPPRCPRFVGKHGTNYLIQPIPAADDTPEELVEMYLDYPQEHRSMGLPPISERGIRDWLRTLHARGTNLLAWDGERVVGHTGFAPHDGEEPEFLVYVDPASHGRGLGTELTRHAIAYAAAAGHRALRLNVANENRTAIAVYRKLGFQVADRAAVELEMRLPLDGPTAVESQLAPAARA